MLKILDRYILKSLISGFLVSFFITTLVMLIGNTIKIYDLLFSKGVNLGLMFKIFADMVAFLSIFTIPMSLMLSINFTYTELSNNSEVTATRSSGVSLLRMFYPAFIFTVFIFAILFYDTSFLAYKARLNYKTSLASAFRNKIYVGLKQKKFYTGLRGATLYAQDLSPRKNSLYDVFYSRKNSVIVAKEAHFQDAQMGIVVDFRKASLFNKAKDSIEFGKVDTYKIAILLDDAKPHVNKNDTRYMTMLELINYYKKSKNLEALYKINKILVFSLSVFVLSIIGFSLGIIFSRSGKSAGAIVSISIFFIFYILQMLGESLFKSSCLIWPIWFPDLVLLFFGSYIFYRKSTN
jgi:lipopolysaccharide export system permease protein